MQRTHLRRLAAGLTVLICTGSAAGQLLQGSLEGHVLDPSAAAVPGAAVSVADERTGFTRAGWTNEAGFFVFPTVPSGVYTVRVSADGFRAAAREGVPVSANTVSRADFSLTLGEVTETSEVTATAAALQADRAEVRRDLGERQLTNLPVPLGRNYQHLFVTLPGVSPPQDRHSIPTNPTRALQFSVNGVSR